MKIKLKITKNQLSLLNQVCYYNYPLIENDSKAIDSIIKDLGAAFIRKALSVQGKPDKPFNLTLKFYQAYFLEKHIRACFDLLPLNHLEGVLLSKVADTINQKIV